MKWYEGAIAEAIAASREKRAMFVVVVLHSPDRGNAKSEEMARLWGNVEETAFSQPMLAIRIFTGTESAQQFSEIYPVPIVPASYLIDLHGKPLDVITMQEDMDDVVFTRRLREAVELMGDKKEPERSSNQPGETTEPTSLATVSSLPIANTDSTSATVPATTSPAMTMDEKAKRARELLHKKHLADEEKKKEAERAKEIERRTTGKLMAEAKASRDEKEVRELAEQRRREKIETERELKRLREQIKADKEERLKRRPNFTQAASVDQATVKPESNAFVQQPIASTECRIQVKFPDGSTLVRTFLSSENLSSLVKYIKKDGRQGSDFYLVQMYPRREFPDTNKSFLELALTPSATLLVVSSNSSKQVVRSGSSSLMSWLQFALIAPLQAVYRMLQVFFGFGGGRGGNSGGTTAKPTVTSSSEVPIPTATAVTSSSTGREREVRSGAAGWQEGNIHRFRNDEDSSSQNSDDEARYNGNSTQQL